MKILVDFTMLQLFHLFYFQQVKLFNLKINSPLGLNLCKRLDLKMLNDTYTGHSTNLFRTQVRL